MLKKENLYKHTVKKSHGRFVAKNIVSIVKSSH